MTDETLESGKDSFTIGTASTGGCIKMYFDDTNAEKVILKAKTLYTRFVEVDKMKKVL